MNRGELVGFVGDNGADKSTFMKMIAGDVTPAGGSIAINGKEVVHPSTSWARDHGVEMVYQDLAPPARSCLCPSPREAREYRFEGWVS
ncbi:ATP-binding cassette domain-containing protein [Rhizobium leguminosarum bv. viciae]|nr:ATP-binding cassette domain-containing protein [Rhizobium leguminosarum bv. viciae]